MSDTVSWFAKRLGQPTAPQPRGLTIPAAPPTIPQPQPQVGAPQVQQPIGQQTYQEVAKSHDGEKIAHLWQGGEAIKTEGNTTCPNCGSFNVFSRRSVSIMNPETGRVGTAKPRCYECGWTQGFIPGDAGNWAG